jgi:hypothetical protein
MFVLANEYRNAVSLVSLVPLLVKEQNTTFMSTQSLLTQERP